MVCPPQSYICGEMAELREDKILEIAVFLAIGVGILLTGIFLHSGQDPYSAIYINTSSIVKDPGQNSVFFVYGVRSVERSETRYTLEIFSGNVLIKNKEFSLKPGEILEEGIRMELPPGTTLPAKISLNLNTGRLKEEVHFWIRE